jgi:hypothetical protein
MNMRTIPTKETKAKLEVKIRITQEEDVVKEKEAEADLIKEISRFIIVKGMVTLKEIVD